MSMITFHDSPCKMSPKLVVSTRLANLNLDAKRVELGQGPTLWLYCSRALVTTT
jgi:hypothetical protein